jgi:hypothetical protein
MAAILLSACTVSNWDVGGVKFVKIVTAATADDGDTIDVSSLFDVGCFAYCSNTTDTVVISAVTYEDKSITLPGTTDDQARTIRCIGQ